jgi:hypothetical protein
MNGGIYTDLPGQGASGLVIVRYLRSSVE